MEDRSRIVGRVAALAASLALVFASSGSAIAVRYGAGLFSHYVWRGITLTDDPVLQPSVTISHDGGVSLEVWGNVDLGDDNDTPWELTEARIVVDWSRQVGAVELGAGAVEYLFPNTPFPGTREVFVHARYDAVVSPRLDLAYDVDEIQGLYARLTLAYRRAFGARWSGGLEASAAWADDSFAVGRNAGLHDGNLELRIERRSGPLDVGVLLAWTESLDAAVLPDQPTSFWTGLSLGYRF